MERLARAVEKTIQAHPYMEVRISDSNTDTPTQFIPYTEPYQQTVMKLSESEWQKTLQSLIAEPLKLIGGRLFRFDLVETECAKYMLRTTHNIAFDGMSYNIIMRDIAAAYNGEELTLRKPITRSTLPAKNHSSESAQNISMLKNGTRKIFPGLMLRASRNPTRTTPTLMMYSFTRYR